VPAVIIKKKPVLKQRERLESICLMCFKIVDKMQESVRSLKVKFGMVLWLFYASSGLPGVEERSRTTGEIDEADGRGEE